MGHLWMSPFSSNSKAMAYPSVRHDTSLPINISNNRLWKFLAHANKYEEGVEDICLIFIIEDK